MYKFLLALLFITTPLSAQDHPLNQHIDSILPPYPTHYLTDVAGVVKNPDIVNARLKEIRDSSQLSLIAVTMPTIGDFDVSDVALEMGRKWKVATANDSMNSVIRNTGGVILLVMDTHKCWISVAMGSEGYVTDNRAANLCRNAANNFRAGDFGGGIISIANGFAKYHIQEVTAAASRPSVPSEPIDIPWLPILGGLGLFSLVGGILIHRHNKKEQERERQMEIRLEQQRREEAICAAAREAAELARWNSLIPEQQAAELAERERRAKLEEARREKEEREAAVKRAREEEEEERESYRRSSSYYDRYSSGGSSSDDSSFGGSSWSGGGSSGFSGGGGGSSW